MEPTHAHPTADQEAFEAVWQRVCPGGCGGYLVPGLPPGAPAPSTAGLERFLREAVEDALSRAACCRPWQALSPIAASCRAEARSLAALLFLRAGVRYLPPQGRPAQRWASLAECCRVLYHREGRCGRRLRGAAQRCGEDGAGALLSQLAQQSDARRAQLAAFTARFL